MGIKVKEEIKLFVGGKVTTQDIWYEYNELEEDVYRIILDNMEDIIRKVKTKEWTLEYTVEETQKKDFNGKITLTLKGSKENVRFLD